MVIRKRYDTKWNESLSPSSSWVCGVCTRECVFECSCSRSCVCERGSARVPIETKYNILIFGATAANSVQCCCALSIFAEHRQLMEYAERYTKYTLNSRAPLYRSWWFCFFFFLLLFGISGAGVTAVDVDIVVKVKKGATNSVSLFT